MLFVFFLVPLVFRSRFVEHKVTKLAVFDTLPSPLITYRNLTKEWATGLYHWFFLVQPSPLPETLIANSG